MSAILVSDADNQASLILWNMRSGRSKWPSYNGKKATVKIHGLPQHRTVWGETFGISKSKNGTAWSIYSVVLHFSWIRFSSCFFSWHMSLIVLLCFVCFASSHFALPYSNLPQLTFKLNELITQTAGTSALKPTLRLTMKIKNCRLNP